MNLPHESSYRGADALAKLADRQIVVCGAGALGSNLVDTLCRQGAKKVRVIDFDRVEQKNIGPQAFGLSDVGALKVAALKSRVFRDTGVEIETIDKQLTQSTVTKFTKGADLLVDVFSRFPARSGRIGGNTRSRGFS